MSEVVQAQSGWLHCSLIDLETIALTMNSLGVDAHSEGIVPQPFLCLSSFLHTQGSRLQVMSSSPTEENYSTGLTSMHTTSTNIRTLLNIQLEKLVAAEVQGDLRAVKFGVTHLSGYRSFLTLPILKHAFDFVERCGPEVQTLLTFLEPTDYRPENTKRIASTPLVDAYLCYITSAFLMDLKQYQKSIQASLMAIKLCKNNPLYDKFIAKLYSFVAIASEKMQPADDEALLTHLMTGLSGSRLYNNSLTEATCHNFLLRHYLRTKQLDLADAFIKERPYPNISYARLYARHAYYHAYLLALQGDYMKARRFLVQKAIKHGTELPDAVGFNQHVYRLLTVLQLLLGEIPDRFILKTPDLSLSPAYLDLVLSVRKGDLHAYHQVCQTYQDRFIAEGLDVLISRLHSNVLIAGLRRLNRIYTQISLSAISTKLGINSLQETINITSKAITEGLLPATLDLERQCLYSKLQPALYSTKLPAIELDESIYEARAIRKMLVKALRFGDPKKIGKKEVAKEESILDQARENEDAFDEDEGGDIGMEDDAGF